jgi:hypothetical protein
VCNECYQITANKNGYSLDRTYSTAEVANPQKPHPGVLEAKVTSITLAIDQVGSMNFITTGSAENNFPPFAGVQFTLRGSKVIGVDTNDQPVYKNSQNITSGAGGRVTASNLEWDSYEVSVPAGSSVDFAGSNPQNPISLLPGQTFDVQIVTTAATVNSLLLKIKDQNGIPVATASATLANLTTGFIATKSAGLLDKGNSGQVFFSGLVAGDYNWLVTQIGYQEATGSASIYGKMSDQVILQPLP